MKRATMKLPYYIIFLLSLLPTLTASAYDVQINVNGNIVNTTCDVDTNSANLNVAMGDQPISALNTAVGVTSPDISFSIKLVNCSDVATGVNIAFSGTVSSDTALLKLDDGGATGIGIEILDDNKTQIPVNVASKNYPLNAGVDNTLNFYARYKTESLPVTAGDANATATFTLTYL